jgi:HlyD family secretion protein
MMNQNMKYILIAVISLMLVGLFSIVFVFNDQDRGGRAGTDAVYTAQRGQLSIHLTETGTIKSRDQFVVKSQVEGRTSIIFVVDEGVVVKKGELLVELDSSTLQDRLVDQQIQVENTDADFVSATENLEVAKIQMQSNIAKAEQDNQFAIEDKSKYLEGDWPKQQMEANTTVTLAEEDLKRATDEFSWSEKLFAEKYISETEYRADELALKRADLEVALAMESLRLLEEYTHKRRIAELDSDIVQMSLTLERVQRESSSDLVQATARLRAREAELNRQKSRLLKIEDQILKTMIYAPADGMVVYATSSEFSWRGDTQPLDEGQEVRERQELIHLPTANSMMVVIRVHESALGKVQIGQKVNISIDALGDSQVTGTVTKIAPLPDAASVFMNPDLKVYDTQIMIDGVYPEIRTGMSCKATILVDDLVDAISVPLQAVVGRGSETGVYVVNGSESEFKPVVSGMDNNAMVHILSGLEAGETVLLTPPLGENESTGMSRPQAPSEDKANESAGGSRTQNSAPPVGNASQRPRQGSSP